MTINDIKKIKNKDYVVLLPETDQNIKYSVEYSFENIITISETLTREDADNFLEFINNNIKTLIIFDYSDFYRLILPYIKKGIKIKYVFKNSLSSMTKGIVRATFTNLMEFCDRDMIDTIGCLDFGTYEVLKNAGYKSIHLILDISKSNKKTKKSNSIGIIGNDDNPSENIYNELSALKLVDYSFIKIIKTMPTTNHFIDFFKIKEKVVNSYEEVIKDNFVNLYCNFSFTNIELILKSMDMGIPCLLGNTDIFDKYTKLKNYLVLDSDDDINEIANKIKQIKNNNDIIMKEYEKFRNDYSKKSKMSISKFLK